MLLSDFYLVQELSSWSGSDSGTAEAESELHFVVVVDGQVAVVEVAVDGQTEVVVAVVDGIPDYH